MSLASNMYGKFGREEEEGEAERVRQDNLMQLARSATVEDVSVQTVGDQFRVEHITKTLLIASPEAPGGQTRLKFEWSMERSHVPMLGFNEFQVGDPLCLPISTVCPQLTLGFNEFQLSLTLDGEKFLEGDEARCSFSGSEDEWQDVLATK